MSQYITDTIIAQPADTAVRHKRVTGVEAGMHPYIDDYFIAGHRVSIFGGSVGLWPAEHPFSQPPFSDAPSTRQGPVVDFGDLVGTGWTGDEEIVHLCAHIIRAHKQGVDCADYLARFRRLTGENGAV